MVDSLKTNATQNKPKHSLREYTKLIKIYAQMFRTILTKKTFILGLLLVSIIFFLIQTKTPLRYDDFDFVTCYKKTESEWVATNSLVSSSSEILDGCFAHRTLKNGRLADILAITSINFLGEIGFIFLNTFAFILFILVYMKIGNLRYNSISLLYFLAITLLVLPSAFETIFWRPGACNYLWGGILFGAFILAYEKIKAGYKNTFTHFICYILLFLTCSYHEALASPILAMLIVDFITTHNKQHKALTAKLLILSITAFLIIISAPGIWNRIGYEVADKQFNIKDALFALTYHSIIPISCFSFYTWKKRKNLLNNPIYIYTLFSFLALCVIGNHNPRAGFYFSIGALILTLRIFSNTIIKFKNYIHIFTLIGLSTWAYNFYTQNALTSDILNFAIKKSQPTSLKNNIIVYDIANSLDAKSLRSKALYQGIYNRGTEQQINQSFTYWNCHPFKLIINALNTNKEIYKQFNGTAKNQYQVLHKNGLTIIRFPLGKEPYLFEKYLHIYNNNGQLNSVARTFIGTSKLGLLKYRLIEQVKVIDYSFDWDGQFFYLILHPLTDSGYIEIPIQQNNSHTFEKVYLLQSIIL